jgi:Protein of unknown function (DUF4236)
MRNWIIPDMTGSAKEGFAESVTIAGLYSLPDKISVLGSQFSLLSTFSKDNMSHNWKSILPPCLFWLTVNHVGFYMNWRWRKSINLGGGARTTITSHGLGVSWGIGGMRVGRAPTGAYWVSLTIPGTGISFFKYLTFRKDASLFNEQISQGLSSDILNIPPQQPPQENLTQNERILEHIKQIKP